MDRQTDKLAMLMGSPRSGTTWLAKIIDSDPTVVYRHEPDSINVRPDIPFVPAGQDVEPDRAVVLAYLELLQQERASKSSGSQPMFKKYYRGSTAEALRRASILAVKGGERVLGGGSFLSRIQIPDFYSSSALPERTIFIKSVSSLCRTLIFSKVCPQARFIHIIRHPCAYVASTIRGKKLGLLSDDAYIETVANMPMAASYGLSIERLRSMTREEQLAARWMLQNEKVMTEMQGNPNYKQVVYEDLCNNPLEVSQGIFEFLKLEVSEQTRNYIQLSSEGKSQEIRYFDLTRDSSKAATKWMVELDQSQIENIKRVVSTSTPGKLYFES